LPHQLRTSLSSKFKNETFSFIFSGSQLQICPRGLTCCTEEMERKLWSISKDQYTKGVKSQAASLMKMFNNRAKKFDGKIEEE